MNRIDMKPIRTRILAVLFLPCMLSAQEKRPLTFDEYLDRVKTSNIGYLAEQYSVDIAEAHAEAARVFPDPELSAGYSNNQNWNLAMGYAVDAELSYTLELGGKRKARVRVAQSEKELTGALLEDYFRNLRADAAIAFLAAVKERECLAIQRESYHRMLDLARADSLRFRAGMITETDARQSKLEAATMLNDVLSGEGDLREALVQLQLFQGDRSAEPPDSIAGALHSPKPGFDLPSLVATAQNNRADLQAALRQREVSLGNLQLARAGRAIDLGLSLGGGYSSVVRNQIAPAPEFWGVTAGISIPLKFSNANKSALRAARLSVEQSERQYEAVELQIRSEVMLAHNKYVTSCRKVEQFDTGLLQEAETILGKKTYSYERGETGILDVLNAQRTYNDVRTSYTEALYECAAALIELERACGIPRQRP
jgi:cobalt-zinc-cadmium efflux system outer membrane protein